MALLLAVPNLSEGRDPARIERIAGPAPPLIDLHLDPDHHRSVLTYAGEPTGLMTTCLALVERALAELDIHSHHGAHPRHGVVDVLPFVPHEASIDDAIGARDEAARRIGELGLPVHLYGPGHPSLPELRRVLATQPPPPAAGPPRPHPTGGRICIGARQPLVAFNVDLRGEAESAGRVARDARQSLPTVRALAFSLPSRDLVQVSMNLTDPARVGPKAAFEHVVSLAQTHGLEVVGCEVVGLVPDAIAVELEALPNRRPPRTIRQALRETR